VLTKLVLGLVSK